MLDTIKVKINYSPQGFCSLSEVVARGPGLLNLGKNILNRIFFSKLGKLDAGYHFKLIKKDKRFTV